jgi:hypothetical protein
MSDRSIVLYRRVEILLADIDSKKTEIRNRKEVPDGILNSKLYYTFQNEIDSIKNDVNQLPDVFSIPLKIIKTLSDSLPFYPMIDFEYHKEEDWNKYLSQLP